MTCLQPGFGGFNVNLLTYPGFVDMWDGDFDSFRNRAAGFAPELDALLDAGPSGLDTWFEAWKQSLGARAAEALENVEFEQIFGNVQFPGPGISPFIPFWTHIFATATTMTRDEYVSFQTDAALTLRASILADDTSNAAIQALAADREAWVDLYLAALEEAELLRPEDAEPPIRERQSVINLQSVLASGVLFGPAGEEIRATGDLATFFEDLRQAYGDPDRTPAEIEFNDLRNVLPSTNPRPHPFNAEFDPRYPPGFVPVAAIPDPDLYDLNLDAETYFQSLRVYVPWLDFESRQAGVPAGFYEASSPPIAQEDAQLLDFSSQLEGSAAGDARAAITGPTVFDTGGFLATETPLPFAVSFTNDAEGGRAANRVEVITELDPDFDTTTFALGDITLGDVVIDVPAGLDRFQRDLDFTETLGFVVRVSAGLDLAQDPAAVRWVMEAIDPLTGELASEDVGGLLAAAASGDVSYTVEVKSDVVTGRTINASARVLLDTRPSADTATLSYDIDAVGPTTVLNVAALGTDRYALDWSALDDQFGSGVRHVTLYAAEDGGNFEIISAQNPADEGSFEFTGRAGVTYEFLALASDLAGNREAADVLRAVAADGTGPDFGALADLDGTAENFGQLPTPTASAAANDLFADAEAAGGTPSPVSGVSPSNYDVVVSPFAGRGFVTGIEESFAGIGPTAILETDDGFLIAGGTDRAQIWRVPQEGGTVSEANARLDAPIYDMALDSEGRLWVATGGEDLLELDPISLDVVRRIEGPTGLSLAVSPVDGTIYVASTRGIAQLDPDAGRLIPITRDLDLRVASIAVSDDGSLWGISWPDRSTVFQLNERGRAETVLHFDEEIDSIAFGQAGTDLEGLLVVSQNSGPSPNDPAALTLVELATLRRLDVAKNGARGDVVITTRDGRILVSNGDQVDEILPIAAPLITATNPPEGAAIPVPLPFLQVTFDQDMRAGETTAEGDVLNPDNYTLRLPDGRILSPAAVTYDAQNGTAYLNFGNLLPGAYSLTVSGTVESVFERQMGSDYVTTFTAVGDLATLLSFEITNTRFERTTDTLSYDVEVRNISGRPLALPLVLELRPEGVSNAAPEGMVAQDGMAYAIDLTDALPEDTILGAGEAIQGRTVSITTQNRSAFEFALAVLANPQINRAPSFGATFEAPLGAQIGARFELDLSATDADLDTLRYVLLDAPAGASLDLNTGRFEWTPPLDAEARVFVSLEVVDGLGARTPLTFEIDIEGGNARPEFLAAPARLETSEGQELTHTFAVNDANGDPVQLVAQGLPRGAVFDPDSRTLTWTPDYDQAGTYTQFRVLASDGQLLTTAPVLLFVAPAVAPPQISLPARLVLAEGDSLNVLPALVAEVAPDGFSLSGNIPRGLRFNETSGQIDWVPDFNQAGLYDLTVAVRSGDTVTTASIQLEVLASNGAPSLFATDTIATSEGQEIILDIVGYDPDNPYYTPPQRALDGSLIRFNDIARSLDIQPVGDLPEGATFDPETWAFRWQPNSAQAGSYTIVFEATDDGAETGVPLSTRAEFEITVADVNQAPVIAEILPVTLAVGESLDIPVVVNDPENGTVSLSLLDERPGFPLPEFATLIDNGDGTGVIRLAPMVGDKGSYALELRASDDGDADPSGAATSVYAFAVAVTSENEPPILTAPFSAIAVVGVPVSVAFSVSDSDDDSVSVSLEGLPPEATLVAGARFGTYLLDWTPGAQNLGAFNATLVARDSTHEVRQTVQIEVRNTNAAPLLVVPANQSLREGEILALPINAVDPDGDQVALQLTGLPDGTRYDPVTGTLLWQPTPDQAGVYTIDLTASDGAATDSGSFTLTVENTSRAPEITPVIEQIAREGGELRFTLDVFDPDGDAFITGLLPGAPAGAGYNAETRTFFWRPDFTQSGSFDVSFFAQDAFGSQSETTVRILVLNQNRTPDITAQNATFVVGETRVLQLSATDADGDDVSFAVEDAPQGLEVTSTGALSWTPTLGQVGERLVTLVASDGISKSKRVILLNTLLSPEPPAVRIEKTPSFASLPGRTIFITPQASSFDGISDVRLFVDGAHVTLDDDGRYQFVADGPGQVALRAEARDSAGRLSVVDDTLLVRDPADAFAPTVTLSGLDASADLTAPVALGATVQDSNLEFWSLSLVRLQDGQTTIVDEGRTAIADLAVTLDPAQLRNGFYQLTLSARDISGRQSTTTRDITVTTATKTTRDLIQSPDTGLTVGTTQIPLTRVFDSFSQGSENSGLQLGTRWQFAGFDLEVESDAAVTGREAFGVFAPYDSDQRVFVTLPDGERVSFRFSPEPLDGLDDRFAPKWVAEQTGHGWILETPSVVLLRGGAGFYEAATGLAYNPERSFGSDPDFTLVSSDGVAWGHEMGRGVTRIQTPDGTDILVGSEGLFAPGTTLAFERDARGRIGAVFGTEGQNLIYAYAENGDLISARNLQSQQSTRYGYTGDRLQVIAPSSGPILVRTSSGDIVPDGDFGGLLGLVSRPQVVSGNGAHRFLISLRESEVAGSASGDLLLQFDAPAGANLRIDGAADVTLDSTGQTHVARFTQAGIYVVTLEDSPPGTVRAGLLGDLNDDDVVDGADSQLLAQQAAGADLNGDAAVDVLDRLLLNANFGTRANAPPVVNSDADAATTFVDVPIEVDLARFVTDPDGDSLFVTVQNVDNGAIERKNGLYLFSPDIGFSGTAKITIIADDGVGASWPIDVPVEVSDAKLLDLRLALGEVFLIAPGDSIGLELRGDFAGAQDVLLPFDYVTISDLDPDIATLASDGTLTATGEGTGFLQVQRDGVADLAAFGVGVSRDADQFATLIGGVDAYPDSVTLAPGGASRAIVTRVGSSGTILSGDDLDAVRYVSLNPDVARVSDTGVIEAVSEGETEIVVLYGYGQDTISVAVSTPVTGTQATLGTQGGVLSHPAGIEVSVGPGLLADTALLTVDPIALSDLDVEPPVGFAGATAFSMNFAGPAPTGPLQVAAAVDPSVAAPGDEVYFFVQIEAPLGENGAPILLWEQVDNGVVDENGIARTASPPFPGLGKNGNILIAKASVPLNTLSVDPLAQARMALVSYRLAMSVSGGLAGVANEAATVTLPYLGNIAADNYEIQSWREFQDGTVEIKKARFDAPALGQNIRISMDVPPLIVTGFGAQLPRIDTLDLARTQQNGTVLTLSGAHFFEPARQSLIESAQLRGEEIYGDDIREARVGFRVAGSVVYVEGSDFLSVGIDGNGQEIIVLRPPQDILLGAAEIFVERTTTPFLVDPANIPADAPPSTFDALRGEAAEVRNTAGYGFTIGRDPSARLTVDVFDINQLGTPGSESEEVLFQIPLPPGAGYGHELIAAPDNSAVYIAHSGGVSILDGLSLDLLDFDPSAVLDQTIDIPGGAQAIALSTDGTELFVAGNGVIHVIDLVPGTADYLRITQTISGLGPTRGGQIRNIELNGDGTKLFVALPDIYFSEPGGSKRTGISRIFNETGGIAVIDVERVAGPVQSTTYRTVLDVVDFEESPWGLAATLDPDVMLATAFGAERNGLRKIVLGTDSNGDPELRVEEINASQNEPSPNGNPNDGGLVLNAQPVGLRPGLSGLSRIGQKFDLDIRNASDIVLTAGNEYAFIADYYQSPYTSYSSLSYAAAFMTKHDYGSKVGIIKDPLGPNPQLLGVTTPIPNARLNDISLDASGTKLYANYTGAQTIAVFNVQEMVNLAERAGAEARSKPLDQIVETGQSSPINEAPIEFIGEIRDIALQENYLIELLGPVGGQDVHGQNDGLPLTFSWKLNRGAIASNAPIDPQLSQFQLFMSTAPGGAGLWPSDQPRGPGPAAGTPATATDPNPGRIYTTPDGTYFDAGYSYTLTVDRNGIIRPVQGAKLAAGDTVEVVVDPAILQILTAGNRYYWGVQTLSGLQASTSFTVDVAEQQTPFASVTVLTHGFQPGDLGSFGFKFSDNVFFQEQESLSALGYQIADTNEGVVLHYDKRTGVFVDRTRNLSGADALDGITGSVVLITDWVRESNISDAGYSEAAADAFYAALSDLDRTAGGDIYDSPLHFLSHSRGTVVNSEIIQRLGLFRPDIKTIQMTTLDPHDFDQNALNLPIGPLLDLVGLIGNVASAAKAGTAIAAGVGAILKKNPKAFTAALASLSGAFSSSTLLKAIETTIKRAEQLGVDLIDVAYDDFLDPDVKNWKNVDFADNYYQKLGATEGFSLTPNGRAIGADIDLNLGATTGSYFLPGFEEDFGLPDVDVSLPSFANGFGGISFDKVGIGLPHGRVIDWYSGTINLSLRDTGTSKIPRQAGDEGIVQAFDLPFESAFLESIIDDVYEIEDTAWYFANAFYTAQQNQDQRQKFANRETWLWPQLEDSLQVTEGIGLGWFYSATGGGESLRPEGTASTDPEKGVVKVPVAQDNTEVARKEDALVQIGSKWFEDTTKTIAASSVFNGNFEQGTAQALSTKLTNLIYNETKGGRFPLSYDLPGWSHHGGEGFGIKSVDKDTGIEDIFDLTGLMLFNYEPASYAVEGVGQLLGSNAFKALTQRQFDAIIGKHIRDYLITLSYDLDQTARQTSSFGDFVATFVDTQASDAFGKPANDNFAQEVRQSNANFNQLAQWIFDQARANPVLAAKLPNIAFTPDPVTGDISVRDFLAERVVDSVGRVFAVDGLQDLIEFTRVGLQETWERFFDTDPNHGLILGAQEVLKDFIALFLPAYADEQAANLDGILDFTSITHNRLFVPADAEELAFEVFSPLPLGDNVKLDVTFNAPQVSFGSDDYTADDRPGAQLGQTTTVTLVQNDTTDGLPGLNSLFSTTTYVVEIPAEARGRMVTFTLDWRQIGDIISDQSFDNFFYQNLDPATAGLFDLAVDFGAMIRTASDLALLDNIRLVRGGQSIGAVPTSNAPAPQPLSSISTLVSEEPALRGALDIREVQALADSALEMWAATGADLSGFDMPELVVSDLDDGILSTYQSGVITLDVVADGHGWFVDLTPDTLEEHRWQSGDGAHVAVVGDAAGRVDLLTVIAHEMGHALGLGHSPAGRPASVMQATLGPGMRLLPEAFDLSLTDHGAGHQSGDPEHLSTDPNQGSAWVSTGNVTLDGDTVRVTESNDVFSGATFLNPTFNDAGKISFEISNLSLDSGDSLPPDAMEVALFDAQGNVVSLGALGALTRADGVANIQSDGSQSVSSGVTFEDTGSGDLVLTIAVQPTDVSTIAAVGFDLFGFGDAQSTFDVTRLTEDGTDGGGDTGGGDDGGTTGGGNDGGTGGGDTGGGDTGGGDTGGGDDGGTVGGDTGGSDGGGTGGGDTGGGTDGGGTGNPNQNRPDDPAASTNNQIVATVQTGAIRNNAIGSLTGLSQGELAQIALADQTRVLERALAPSPGPLGNARVHYQKDTDADTLRATIRLGNSVLDLRQDNEDQTVTLDLRGLLPSSLNLERLTVDWGDGTVKDVGRSDGLLSQHRYAEQGVYRVRIMLELANGQYEVFVLVGIGQSATDAVRNLLRERGLLRVAQAGVGMITVRVAELDVIDGPATALIELLSPTLRIAGVEPVQGLPRAFKSEITCCPSGRFARVYMPEGTAGLGSDAALVNLRMVADAASLGGETFLKIEPRAGFVPMARVKDGAHTTLRPAQDGMFELEVKNNGSGERLDITFTSDKLTQSAVMNAKVNLDSEGKLQIRSDQHSAPRITFEAQSTQEDLGDIVIERHMLDIHDTPVDTKTDAAPTVISWLGVAGVAALAPPSARTDFRVADPRRLKGPDDQT